MRYRLCRNITRRLISGWDRNARAWNLYRDEVKPESAVSYLCLQDALTRKNNVCRPIAVFSTTPTSLKAKKNETEISRVIRQNN